MQDASTMGSALRIGWGSVSIVRSSMFSRASLERGPRYRVMVVRNLVDPPVVLSRGRFRLYVLHVRSSQTWTCGSYAFGLKGEIIQTSLANPPNPPPIPPHPMCDS